MSLPAAARSTSQRAALIEPTTAGQALRHEVERVWSRLEDLVTAGLYPEERGEALPTLEHLERNLIQAAADPAGNSGE
ncbi:hypothetical protein [Streptomyces sp. NPDC003480]